MHSRVLLSLLLAAPVLGVGACAGSGAGLDSNGRPLGSEGGVGSLTASLKSIQDNVFTPICSVCHAGGAAPKGLRLDAANSYAMIVGVPSVEDSSLLRIKPGDPGNSDLVQKIEGHASVGAQMPFGGPPLPATTITTIRQWVTDGALQSSAVATPGSLVVETVAPASGDIVLEAPARIIVSFNRELDRTRLDESSVRVERIAPDGGAPAVVAVNVSVPAGNPSTLLVGPREPFTSGRYRLIATAASGTGVSDLAGNRLGSVHRDSLVTDFTVETVP